jgi:hypothetical protein
VAPVTRTGPTRTLPVAAPPRVASWLRAAPDGTVGVLHHCREAVYLEVAGRCVGVVSKTAPGLPNCLRTSLPWVTTGLAPTPYLVRGTLYLDGRALMAGRFVDVRAPRLDLAGVLTSPAGAKGSPRPCLAGLVPGSSRITPTTLPALIGNGGGLTPLGDDVVCGWLAVHRAAGVPTPAVDDVVRRLLPRTTTLSATLLECALAGEVADPLADLLRALGTPAEPDARARLECVGHTSGAGMAHGLDLALVALTARRDAA